MKIMHLHPGMELGGGEASIVGLVNALSDDPTSQISLVASSGPMCTHLSAKSEFISLTASNPIKRWIELSQIIRQHRPDVLHIHSVGFGLQLLVPRLLSQYQGMVVITKHAKGFKGIPESLAGIAIKLVANRYIALSQQMKTELQSVGIADEKIDIVPHVINVSKQTQVDISAIKKTTLEELNLSDTDYIVTIAARLDSRKGLHDFIDSIAVAHKQNKRIKGLIVGNGELKQALMDYAKNLGIKYAIIFPGYRSDIEALLRVTQVVLTLSEEEVLPVFVLEAMASGTPVIANNLPEFENVIEHDVDGFLVNSAAEASQVILRLVDNSELFERISEAARQTIRNKYNSSTVVEQLSSVYSKNIR